VVASLHPLFSVKGAIIAPRLSRLWLKLVSREIIILEIIAFYHEERLSFRDFFSIKKRNEIVIIVNPYSELLYKRSPPPNFTTATTARICIIRTDDFLQRLATQKITYIFRRGYILILVKPTLKMKIKICIYMCQTRLADVVDVIYVNIVI
jgi:hypothetical protein